MNYEDEAVEADEVVRGFMITGGRVRAAVAELPVEAMVTATPQALQHKSALQFERQQVVAQVSEPAAIAEIAAILKLPLRSVQVLASEMVAAGDLRQLETVSSADSNLLRRIRVGVAAL